LSIFGSLDVAFGVDVNDTSYYRASASSFFYTDLDDVASLLSVQGEEFTGFWVGNDCDAFFEVLILHESADELSVAVIVDSIVFIERYDGCEEELLEVGARNAGSVTVGCSDHDGLISAKTERDWDMKREEGYPLLLSIFFSLWTHFLTPSQHPIPFGPSSSPFPISSLRI
jgi:hypothetical protein